MKILVAHARYAQPGGEEAVVDAQQRALETLGHQVVRYECDNAGLQATAFSKVRAGSRAVWSRRSARAIGEMVAREKPDVLHVHNNFQELSPSIYDAAARLGVRVVQHLHNARLACISVFFERDGRPCTDCLGRRVTWPGVVHRCYRDSRADSLAATAVQLSHRAIGAGRRVDRFVAVSAALAEALIGGGVVPRAKTVVCHNGVDALRLDRNDRGFALFVGRVSAEKGVQVLLDAAASVPEMPLRIAGDGPGLDGFRDQAERRGLRHVTFLGRLGPDERQHELARARVTVVPSVGFDPLPTVALEAAAAGVAAIGSATGGVPEIIGSEQTGVLVPPGDVPALAGALRRAHAEPDRMRSMGDAARIRYEAAFSTAAFGARLVSIYDDLLAR